MFDRRKAAALMKNSSVDGPQENHLAVPRLPVSSRSGKAALRRARGVLGLADEEFGRE
jgi:hypothetical protein